jgi:hypothetical protein
VTYCEDCDHVCTSTREKPPYAWRCMRAPVEPGVPLLSRDYSPDPPYEKCATVRRDAWVRHGIDPNDCPMFEPRRNGHAQQED